MSIESTSNEEKSPSLFIETIEISQLDEKKEFTQQETESGSKDSRRLPLRERIYYRYFRKHDLVEVSEAGRFVIIEDTLFRKCWSVIWIAILFYLLFVAPFQMLFLTRFDIPNLIVDAIFVLDVFLSFFFSYEDPHSGFEVVEHKKIVYHYLTGWFIPDLISCVPFIFDVVVLFHPSLEQTTNLIYLLKIVRIFKILHAFKYTKWFWRKGVVGNIVKHSNIRPLTWRITKILVTFVCVLNILACIWFYIGASLDDGSIYSWLNRFLKDGEDNYTVSYKYLASIYFVLTTFSTVGYGDITAYTTPELLFACILLLLGTVFFSYITATFSSYIIESDRRFREINFNRRNLRSLLETFQVPEGFQQQVMMTMIAYWKDDTFHDSTKNSTDSETNIQKELINQIPQPLVFQLVEVMFHSLIEDSEFLKFYLKKTSFRRNISLTLQILKHGSLRQHFKGSYIAWEGQKVEFWYVVVEGEVELSLFDSVEGMMGAWKTITRGSILGQLELFGNIFRGESSWLYSVRCTSNSAILLQIESSKILKLGAEYGILEEFREICQSELEELSRLKEISLCSSEIRSVV